MTPVQCRAARGLLKWTQDDLSSAANISVVALRNFENEKTSPQRSTLTVIQLTLEAAGVVLIPENGGGAGVRLRDRQG